MLDLKKLSGVGENHMEPDKVTYYCGFIIDYYTHENECSVKFKVRKELVDIPYYIKGDIKWDGCMNLNYYCQLHDTPIHFCDLRQHRRHLDLIEKVYEESASLMGDNANIELMQG